MAGTEEFEERMARWRESQNRPGSSRMVDCSPRVTTEFIAWVFEQEAMERQKREGSKLAKMVMQVALDRAAVHVSELDALQWVQWVAYFLECLDALGRERGMCPETINEFLGAVHRLVSERTCLGSW